VPVPYLDHRSVEALFRQNVERFIM
jgi:hypothetical protein